MKCFYKFIFFFGFIKLALGGSFSSKNYTSPCSEILKHSFFRNQKDFKKEIFHRGDKLLKEFFGHSDFFLLKKEEKELFVFKNRKKIVQNLVYQGTAIEPIGDSTAFVIRGGESRLGRVASGLNKIGVSLILDWDVLLKINAAGFYSPKRHFIILGLEDALYPNQLSFNLWHEAMHASLDSKALFIPRIYDEAEDKSYEDFSVDEVVVYSKQINHMVNARLGNQNVEFYGTGRNKNFLSAIQIFKELSIRTLNKKNELLKVVDHLNEVERDPSVLNIRMSRFLIEGLDPQIYLFRCGFTQYLSSQLTQELLKADPSIRLRVFQGDPEAYYRNIKQRAKVSREIILKALELAESVKN
jgi:hypothetical protein